MDHSPSNLTLRCSACHAAHHKGLMTIGGSAPDHLTLDRKTAPVTASKPLAPVAPVPPGFDSEARAALTTLGWSPNVSRTAVAAARARLGAAPLTELIREALRSCPRPSTS